MKLFSLATCVLGAALTLTSAEAAQCPSGQIYRVSKGVCVSKAEFQSFMKKGPAKKSVAPVEAAEKPATPAPAEKAPEKPEKPAVRIASKAAPLRLEDSKEPPREYFPETPAAKAYSAPTPTPSPFGALTPAFSLK